MMQPENRRKERGATRHSAELACQLFAETSGRGITGTAVDVSESGVRLRSAAEVVVGEPVVVTIALPNGSGWVDALGRVARIERGQRECDDGPTIAVEFSAIEETDVAKLVLATAHLPEPKPRRGVFRLAGRRWR